MSQFLSAFKVSVLQYYKDHVFFLESVFRKQQRTPLWCLFIKRVVEAQMIVSPFI